MLSTRLTARFGLDHPVVLAPMISAGDAGLATAVVQAGGLGLLGAAYGERTWVEQELTRAAGAGIGCGFITWSLAQDPHLLEIALAHQPSAIFLSFGDPTPFAERIHAANVPLICQVGNLTEANRALTAGADVIVAQGSEAAGHGRGERTTFTLVPDVVDLVSGQAPSTLVLAAGGVVDGRGLAAALMLGADGVLVGTRLWATLEAAVPCDAHRRALAASSDDTIRTSIYDIVRELPWEAPHTARVLRNRFLSQWHGHEDELRTHLQPAQRSFQAAAAKGDFEAAPIIVGQGIGRVTEILSVADVINGMVTDAENHLGRFRS